MSFINVRFLQDVRKKAQAIQKQNTFPHVFSHGGYEYLE